MRKIFSIIIAIAIVLLSGCAEVDLSETKDNARSNSSSSILAIREFTGAKGNLVDLVNDKITLDASEIDDGKAHYYNTTLPSEEPVYFFIVKSPDGKLRAAANGCQICGRALQGFRQEGDYMVCNTCGNRYPLNKIATEKGGCNPAPINPDLEVQDGKVSISLAELQDIRQFFQ